MSILCAMFGHKTMDGVYSGAEYMRLTPGAVDGIGRVHCTLFAKCRRCGEEYRAGMLHLREDAKNNILYIPYR